MRFIAVAVGAPSNAELRARLERAAARADVVELRLDYLEEPPDLARLLAQPRPRVIVTNRPTREGGRYRGDEATRLATLGAAGRLGADYLDVELDSVARLGDRGGARLIVSRHDLDGMPGDLAGLWEEIAATGADVVKVVGRARDARDNLAVLALLEQADRPTIAIALGEAGLPSRVLALRHDACFLTFAALDGSAGTAPGQLALTELLDDYHARQIGPATVVYGFLGPRVESERVHEYNRGFRRHGLDAVCVPFPCPAQPAAVVRAFRDYGVAGYHVHPPLQETVVAALDELDLPARVQGRVNAIYRRGDALVGTFVPTPAEQFLLWTGRPL